MKNYWPLLLIAVLLAAIVGMSQYAESSKENCEDSAGKVKAAEVAKGDDSKASNNAEDACKPPIWARYFTWPEGVGAWAVIITIFVIAWQSVETRTAAQATRDSVEIQEVEFRQWVDIADWEIDTSPPKLYSDIFAPGSAKPKDVLLNVTFAVVNPTPRPLAVAVIATDLQVMGWPSWRYFNVDERREIAPQGKYGVMMSISLTGDEVDRFWADGQFVSVVVYVSYENSLGQKSDWSFPFMSKFGRNGSFILTAYNQAKEAPVSYRRKQNPT
jgi:uncharacterized protein (UPF0333 family)